MDNSSTGDALQANKGGGVQLLSGGDVKSAILSPDERAIPKSEIERLMRKAKTMIALGHEIVNALEGLK